MGSESAVAVVVPTHDRASLLRRLIPTLEAQRGAPPFEVIVIDDCSTDDTATVLRELAARSSLALTVLRTDRNSGPATARNLGWRSSAAPLIVFTDDDCVPDAGWLAAMADALGRAEVVQGRTNFDPVLFGKRGPFGRSQAYEEWSDYFATCNIGYQREVLERLDGFDERFRRPFGEDVDLGWRAVESGATTEWVDNAVIVHDVETSGNRLVDWVRWVSAMRLTQYGALMVKLHPIVRRTMYHRWFFRASHPPTLTATAGLMALLAQPRSRARWRAAALAAAPYVYYRLVIDPRPGRPAYRLPLLPLVYVGDTVEVAAILWGSIRFRTVLL